jgi:molybdate transport system ATP-binding protein
LNNAPEARLIHHHHLSVQRRVGSLEINVELNLSAQWTLLFGPSGSGKSSLLRAACGLLGQHGVHLTRWQERKETYLTLQDETTFVPTHQRGIRLAPQNGSLFPHLTVRQNVEFGARSDRPTNAGQDEYQRILISSAIDLFRLEPLLSRLPQDLSGGERQRVNLARAFAAPGCQLMLLDEPFAGIDRTLRDELLPQMRALLSRNNIPALSVSHDVEEAFQLQAEVVLIRDGKVEDQGYVGKVLAPERNRLLHSLR